MALFELGPSAASPVVVAHGAGSSARFVIAAFAGPVLARGRRLVTFDQRGHGASGPVRAPAGHALERYAADLEAVVAEVGGDAWVVGVSLGGHAAVRAAASERLEATAVVACLPAWTGAAVPGEGPHAAIAAEVRALGLPDLLTRLTADTAMPGWLRDTLLTDYRRHDPDSLIAALLALDGGEAPTLDELARLPVPFAAVGWPDDPGHPLSVARAWADAADGPLRMLHLHDLDAGLERLGEAALAAAAQATE
ncbi:alpha/beta fold hydrolase [Egicoccus sp. AB-alg6-2]|uniref:alpha/beta fold hydrolase n=1 Tax=Egicoccus sp. AB-alg6-2 TaxID=3242692 RepID=UPI00359DE961